MDPTKIQQFRSKALNMGHNLGAVNNFLVRKLSERIASSQSQQANPSISGGLPQISAFQNLGNGIMNTILPMAAKITQQFGNRSNVERFSGGVNYGTDFAIPTGTKVALPPGQWEVVEAFAKARAAGPNNPQRGANRGYGNSVLVKNKETGEKLRFSHLSRVGAQSGQTLKGGSLIGLSGATGNVAGRTGQHLDLEYYNQKGKAADVLRSVYAKYLGR